MPPRLPNPRNRNQSNKNTATVLALFGMLMLAAGMFGVAAMVLGPGALAVVGLGALLVLFIAFHYFVWGKWLSKRLQQDPDES